jgi:hypothetical protein
MGILVAAATVELELQSTQHGTDHLLRLLLAAAATAIAVPAATCQVTGTKAELVLRVLDAFGLYAPTKAPTNKTTDAATTVPAAVFQVTGTKAELVLSCWEPLA